MWRYYSYDVWGNAAEGFDVNNVFRTSDVSELPKDAPLVSILRDLGFHNNGRGIADIGQGDGDVIYLERERDGYPAGELRWEEEPARSPREGHLPPFQGHRGRRR